ncbi:MAG: hypothetical protein LUG12_09990 [Erysipelotrichaceae bacterium]|nr:hypothetical protein [Erysipelotrichaceae bacterium]
MQKIKQIDTKIEMSIDEVKDIRDQLELLLKVKEIVADSNSIEEFTKQFNEFRSNVFDDEIADDGIISLMYLIANMNAVLCKDSLKDVLLNDLLSLNVVDDKNTYMGYKHNNEEK